MAFVVDSCDLVGSPPRPPPPTAPQLLYQQQYQQPQQLTPQQSQLQQQTQAQQQHQVRDAFRSPDGLRTSGLNTSPESRRWQQGGVQTLGALEAAAHNAVGLPPPLPSSAALTKNFSAQPSGGKGIPAPASSHIPAIEVPSAGPAALTGLHKFVGFMLSTFDVALAAEIVKYANDLREKRVQARLEKNGAVSASMKDAISIIVKSRNPDVYSGREAEAIVRRRRGAAALARVGQQAPSAAGPLVGIGKLLLLLITMCGLLPLSILMVVLSAPVDIILLLLRPLLSADRKRSLTPWVLPSSLAFWGAGMAGYMGGLIAHRLLGCSVVDTAFLSLNLGGELCKIQAQNVPPTMAFQAAVACDPCFLEHRSALRAMALRGIAEFYAPAGGPLAAMPAVVKWAYLLGDAELQAAWEAEALGRLPASANAGNQSGGASIVGAPWRGP